MAGSEPPSRKGVTYLVATTVLRSIVHERCLPRVDDLSKSHPPNPVKAKHLHLFDGVIVGGARVQLDSWQQHRVRYVLETGGLAHEIFSCELVAAALQYFDECNRRGVAVGVAGIVRI